MSLTKSPSSIPKWQMGVIIFTCGIIIGRALHQFVEKVGLFG